MSAILLGCLLGLAQGVRHALEPDHVTAVSTLVAGQRTPRKIVSFAAIWGLGHALTLLVVGGALALFRAQMPARLADVFELVVAFMLVGLGVRALARARSSARAHAQHAQHVHAHAHGEAGARAQPLGVGIVHGLAGSGALAALATASFASRGAGVLFIAIYGAGAAIGMALLAAAAVVPMARLAKSAKTGAALMAAAGVLSIAFGVAWGWPVAARLAEGAAAAAPTPAGTTSQPNQ